ncbi:hypothetical protein niasHT_007321 [Heterodera trifolii]|uniref:Apple domain-containing protein n=1 Tax=Heterodera trifolii TaxID=157864 RepID=A0ABD2LLP6_9BILA
MAFLPFGQFEPCCSSFNYSFIMFGSRVVGAAHSNGQQKTDRKQTVRWREKSVGNWSNECHHQSLGTNCSQIFLFMVSAIALISINGGTMAQNTGKCYSFSPGLTIPGADYRRDFGLSRRECAEVCKSDLCCMAFEWRRNGGQCTLKSRSLNGTVTAATKLEDNGGEGQKHNTEQDKDQKDETNGGGEADATFFALCLDYGDSDRDRFWDHELFGPVVASVAAIERGKCAELCDDFTTPVTDGKRFRRAEKAKSERKKGPAVIYSWRSHNPSDVETPLGECQCISVLQHIRVSFGSFAGFLI